MSLAESPKQVLPEVIAQREATARLLWTGGIIGFFVIQALLWVVAITLTAQDPSHAVLEGYDQRALDWDSWQSALKASAALGWKAELRLGAVTDVAGSRDLTLRLVDRQDQPVSGAEVNLKIFHRARAAEAESLYLAELVPGEYQSSFRPQRSGTWRFEVTASRGPDRFLEMLQLQLAPPGANPAEPANSNTFR